MAENFVDMLIVGGKSNSLGSVIGCHIWFTEDKQSVEEYLATLNDEQTAKDSQVLIAMMQRISGHEPRLYNAGTIGFGTYHYKSDSGREGDAATICFYPRKNKITIYLMDGTARYADLLAKLGNRLSPATVCTSSKSVISSC